MLFCLFFVCFLVFLFFGHDKFLFYGFQSQERFSLGAVSMASAVPTKHFEETGWWEYAIVDGEERRQFYYHGLTRQKSWSLPPCLVSDWWEVFSPEHLRYFYFQLSNGEVSWLPPPETASILRGVSQFAEPNPSPPCSSPDSPALSPSQRASPSPPHFQRPPRPASTNTRSITSTTAKPPPPPLSPYPISPQLIAPIPTSPPCSPPGQSGSPKPIEPLKPKPIVHLGPKTSVELNPRVREQPRQVSPVLHHSFGHTSIAQLTGSPSPPPLPVAGEAFLVPPPRSESPSSINKSPSPPPFPPVAGAPAGGFVADLASKMRQRPKSMQFGGSSVLTDNAPAFSVSSGSTSAFSPHSPAAASSSSTSASSSSALPAVNPLVLKSPPKKKEKKKGSGLFGWSSKRSERKPKSKEFSHRALLKEIHQFQFETYAEKHFDMHRSGIFKRTLSHTSMLIFSAEPLQQPFLKYSSTALAKEAITCFNRLLVYCGIGATTSDNTATSMQCLIWMGLQNPELRDELYLHIAKQLSGNTRPTTLPLLWKLIALYTQHFPPTKDLEEWLFSFLLEHSKPIVDKDTNFTYNESVGLYAKFCLNKLPQICRIGASGRLPSIPELEQLSQSVFLPGCFGRNVRDLLQEQAEAHPTLSVPLVLVQIVENLRRLDCFHEEGIFRIPGDHDRIVDLRLQLDRGVCSLDQLRKSDVHNLSSLLKLWLQYIPHPLFPNFNDVIQASTDLAKAQKIVANMPPINKEIFAYIVVFLKEFLHPDHVTATKMNLSNLSICFAAVLFHCDTSDVNIFVKSSAAQAAFLQLILESA